MNTELGFQKESFIYIDPRTKLLLLILCSFAALREPRLLFQGLMFVLTFLLLINGRQYIYACKMLLVYAVMCGIHFFVANAPEKNGLLVLLMGVMVFRMFVPVVMVFTFMIRTTRVSEFLAAFHKMHMPKEITIPFSVMFRFFPTIGEEWTNIRNAMKIRGFAFNLKNVITRPAFIYECVIVPLLSDTVIIADEISAASLCRGLGGSEVRTCVTETKMGVVDYLLIIIAISLNVVSFFAY
ncbi:MAG: energy-coupling factor transporter transmembrane protein EcfT [Lachnospiraceae bacterium]|nr:energy-coupling factor transporter transmembrane protein EcfT [Lachnospiraceae bacterium]